MLEIKEDLAVEEKKVFKLQQKLLILKIRTEESRSPLMREVTDLEEEDADIGCGVGQRMSSEANIDNNL